MTDKDKIDELRRLADQMYDAAAYITTDASCLKHAMEEYRQFILVKFHEEEPVSEDFEEALSLQWKAYNDRGAATVDALEDNTQELAFAKGFYYGANWHKEKLMKDAIDGKVCWYDGDVYLDTDDSMFLYFFNHNRLEVGDKVKVIIIKED